MASLELLQYIMSIDTTATPNPDVANWSETRWNGCWNAEAGVGLYLHAGRYREDLDMWWAQVIAYLPGDELCVDRIWGRNTNPAGVTIAGLDITMTEDGWRARYDGVGQLTTIGALALAPQGAGVPVRSFGFEVEATGVQPVWDMFAGVTARLDFAGDAHIQQAYATSGSLTVGDAQHDLGGIGFKDHSSGARSFTRWYAHRFMLIVAEDWACHAVVFYSPDGVAQPPIGAFFRDGEQRKVARFELPLMEDSAGGPVHGEAVIEIEGGETFTFASELVHAFPMTMTMDNEYVNGVDWESAADNVVLIEGKGKLVAPDGSVAWCFHERSALRSLIDRPR
ncbi:MAG: hypothetical protein QOF76_156 [Solirubrobacteraceae bacterium]|nr:hypothetical protein [Solirubrobacteraceae bacterium]